MRNTIGLLVNAINKNEIQLIEPVTMPLYITLRLDNSHCRSVTNELK